MSKKSLDIAENIYCCDCEGRVKMMHAHVIGSKRGGVAHVEFETVCVECGRWDSSVREAEYLPYCEREFCKREKLPGFTGRELGRGVYAYRH